ncbi:MAG: class I SAM-dependent methyltransferase [Thermodesulfovibrionales bacterium]|jgi:demethylmenaquinone methyltransferase/2-methoxy-6-polyprenyl-1,4-benzoquinol methylase
MIQHPQSLHEKNRPNLRRYRITALFYDLLDLPWEIIYRKWRPILVGDVRGTVLEAGVGTGRNLRYYHRDVTLTAMDLSPAMLRKAQKRARDAVCSIDFVIDDACLMTSIPSAKYDWIISLFLCCVMPEEVQPLALEQFARVLKPGGHFRLLEMLYSRIPSIRKRQERFAGFVEKVYGARFDRNTLQLVERTPGLEVTGTRFLKDDSYLLIEGTKPAATIE